MRQDDTPGKVATKATRDTLIPTLVGILGLLMADLDEETRLSIAKALAGIIGSSTVLVTAWRAFRKK